MYNFIVNPASHSGKGMYCWTKVEAILKDRNIPYRVFFSKGSGDITRYTRELCRDAAEGHEVTIVALGGDGTVNEAIQGIDRFAYVRFGYIPTGSGNDLARAVGISRRPQEALEAVLESGDEYLMDIGIVSWQENGVEKSRRFIDSCSMGYDAAICQEALHSDIKDFLNRLGLGKLTYLGIGLKQMLRFKMLPARLTLDGGEPIFLKDLLFIENMSHGYAGGGFCFCPQAVDNDGLLDLCVVHQVPKWKQPVVLASALWGKHFIFAGVKHYRASSIKIQTAEAVWVQTDGEIPGKLDQIALSVEKQQLRFINTM